MSMFSQHGSYNPSKYCMRIYPLLTSISLISTILGTILVVFRNFLPFIPPQFKETGSLRGTFFTHEATSIQKLSKCLSLSLVLYKCGNKKDCLATNCIKILSSIWISWYWTVVLWHKPTGCTVQNSHLASLVS